MSSPVAADGLAPLGARDAVARFLAHLETERRSPHETLQAYRCDLESLLAFLDAHEVPDNLLRIDVHVLRGWLGQLARTHAPSSVARKVAAVRSFMRWLRVRHLLDRSPADGSRRRRSAVLCRPSSPSTSQSR